MLLAASHADTEVLTCLVIDLSTVVAAHDSVEIRHDLPLGNSWAPFEDDHLVELLAFGLVHIHHHDTGFGFDIGREVLLDECLSSDRQRGTQLRQER